MSIADVTRHFAAQDAWHGKIDREGPFPPETGRYHLYIGLFCPFAHRVNLVRQLYNLQDVIGVSIVKPYPKGDSSGWPGWQFPKTNEEYPDATIDKLFASEYLHEVYFKADKEYKGRYSVPVIWDTKTGQIVSNESAEILRWLPEAFEGAGLVGDERYDLYPEDCRAEIDRISKWMQEHLNSGVYKAGFAATQEQYDKNVIPVFASLNKLEKLLHKTGGPFLLGHRLTELDIRLYATIVRFDVVYVQHFKCNLGTIRHDYPLINRWLTNLYHNISGFKETTDFKHIKENYTKSHNDINPKAITPRGPFPHVEDFKDLSASELLPGGVHMPEVVAFEDSIM